MKIGDKVVITLGKFKGKKGVIKVIDRVGDYAIELDEEISTHSCDGLVKPKRGDWAFQGEGIKLIKSKPMTAREKVMF